MAVSCTPTAAAQAPSRFPAKNTSKKRACSKRLALTRFSTPRVVVAGLRGGSGKTTLSVGLTAALARKGLVVTPFKKGPDYIDAGWLASAAGRACYNLDPFLLAGEKTVLRSFITHAEGADIAVIEGNRGLFDGMDPKGSYSTSNLARLIKAPVVLIVDCTKTTRTTAAVLSGIKDFERGLRIGGVVLNQVSGARHERVTREAVEHYTGLPVLGAIPRLSEAELPERHMGLTPWQEHPDVQAAVGRAADIIDSHVNVERVLEIARDLPSLAIPATKKAKRVSADIRIGVIRDSAFQFYYPENIETLRKLGAEVVEFSALTEKNLPAVDALYIGGGFPETHAIALSKNRPFRKSLLAAIEGGLPVYAECGGLMFLGDAITLGKKSYPMAGVFQVSFELHERPSAHGYTRVKVIKKNPFYPKGTELRGHEFHYSEVVGKVSTRSLAFEMTRGTGIVKKCDALIYKNVLATYTHIHALGVPAWAEGMVSAAQECKKSKVNISSDAWLLLAVMSASIGGEGTVERIVQAGDAINHAIFTSDELEGGFRRLLALHLIKKSGDRYSVTLEGAKIHETLPRSVNNSLKRLVEILSVIQAEK